MAIHLGFSHRRSRAAGRTQLPLLLAVGSLLTGPFLVTHAHAQLPPLDPSGRSGTPPPLLKERPLEPRPAPFEPEAVPPTPKEKVDKFPLIRVFVREIRILGNTVFSESELAKVTAPFTNRELATEDLETLRLALTLHYVNQGYVTSGAIIPDQTVTDGIITVHIIEGELSQIDIQGNEWFRSGYLEDRLRLSAGPPIQIHTLQERLQLLQQDPRLERINAELRPSTVRGQSELHVKVSEERPYKAWLEFNNFQTPVVGAERGLATIAHQNLTGNGDIFAFTYGRSDGVNPIIDTSYALPITAYDTTLTGSYRRNDFLVVEAPFEVLDIKSQAEIIGLTLRHPVYRTLNQEFALSLIGEHLFNKTFLLGSPFDFIAGSQDGVANVSALRFLQEWVYRTQSWVLAARSRFSVGLDVLGATNNSGAKEKTVDGTPVADGQFFSWLGQFQGAKRFDHWGGLQVLGRFDAQLANDRLFPLEQFPLGGRFTVRGYRENTLVRDNAFLASLEARIPVIRSAAGEDILQVAPFLDAGQAWNSKVSTPTPKTLASLGLGLRWNFFSKNRGFFEVYWGVPLNHVETAGGNLQDHGIHLQFVVQAF